MRNCQGVYFEEELDRLIGEFVCVLIQTGDECCKQVGVLCNVEDDFLVLINNNIKTEIIIDAVVAIKKEVFKTDCC